MNLKPRLIETPIRNGALIVSMLPYRTLASNAIIRAFEDAVPEYREWNASATPSDKRRLDEFYACAILTSVTEDMRLGAIEPTLEDCGAMDFWAYIQNTPDDYRSIWDAYQYILPEAVTNEWWKAHSNIGKRGVSAPPELRLNEGQVAELDDPLS